MHAKTIEASEWRKKCEKMAAPCTNPPGGDSTGAQGVSAPGDYYAAYVYGALLGASAVAIIGYGALSYSLRRREARAVRRGLKFCRGTRDSWGTSSVVS